MGTLNNSPEWHRILLSQQFPSEIMDAVASMVFPLLGFGGWKEHYTANAPAWRLSYALPLWAKGVERVWGWGVQKLFRLPPNFEIPFFEADDVQAMMKQVVEQTIGEQGWGPILEAVREMPCDEDFEKWDTHVRKDFLRKWYHTRSKRVRTVSLEACMEDKDSKIHSLPAPEGDVAEQAAEKDFCNRFKAALPERDRTILELRGEGYGYQEIADKLGYKTHSAVIKRMEAIKKRFVRYENEEGQLSHASRKMAGVAFLYPNSERRLYASVERLTAHGAGRKRFAVSHGCKTAPGGGAADQSAL